MIALFNFTPHYCPQCGKPITFADKWAEFDYEHSASHSCHWCGLVYTKVDSAHLVEASNKQGSDLAQYVKE